MHKTIEAIKKIHKNLPHFSSRIIISILLSAYSYEYQDQKRKIEEKFLALRKDNKNDVLGNLYHVKEKYLLSKAAVISKYKAYSLYQSINDLKRWNVYTYYDNHLEDLIYLICTHQEALKIQEDHNLEMYLDWAYVKN